MVFREGNVKNMKNVDKIKKNAANLKTRVISAVALMVVMTVMLLIGRVPLWVLCLVISLLGMYELCNVLSAGRYAGKGKASGYLGLTPDPNATEGRVHVHRPMMYLGMALTIVWYVLALVLKEKLLNTYATFAFMIIMLLILMCACVAAYPKRHFSDAAITFMAVVYVAVSISCIYFVRIARSGGFLVWYIIGASWGADTFAYFTGMFLGKHKMAPVLSPKKTVEGAVGGVLGAIVLCVIYGMIICEPIGADRAIMFKVSLFIGLLGSLASEVGDLFASSVKRVMNVKDYSNLIPGHGGILDRFDSTIAVAPVTLILLYVFGVI